MTTPERMVVPGGVRASLRRTPLQRLRQARQTRQLGSCGSAAFVEKGAEFLRHPERIHLGDNVIVKQGARLCPANADASISVGDWTSIGYHTHIFATAAISIGADCLVAPFCYLVDADHGMRRGQLIRTQPMEAAPIVVEQDVWLGAGVVVLAGVTIGTGAVVAAGAVVNSDIPAYVVAGGNPAKVIKDREGSGA